MKSNVHSLIPILLVVPLMPGCSTPSTPDPADYTSETSQAVSTEDIMTRAQEWVTDKVPYCQAANGDFDSVCGYTCNRPAAAWDNYRSDCSGYVSWCWQLPDDPTTDTFKTDRAGTNGWTTISIDDLQAGDALVTDGHIKLFSHFVDSNTMHILEEPTCNKVAHEDDQDFARNGNTLTFDGDSRVYHPIRRNGVTGGAGTRVGAVATNGHLYVKDGSLSAGWTDESPSAVSASLTANRIGYLATNGHFYVKEGGLATGWTDEYAGVTAGVLSGDRIAVISGGHLLVKEGGLSTAWHDLSPSAVAVALTPTRVGYLSSNGHFYVKDGSLSASWSDESPSATDIALSGDRIGYLATNGHFYVKDGSLSASWSDEAPSATAIALGGTRIGYLASNGHFYVKEGSLSASWSDEAPSAASVVLGGDRIGYVATTGAFYVKEGSLSATWHNESPSVIAGALSN